MSVSKIVICGAARSPVGAVAGALSSLKAHELVTIIGQAVLANAKCDAKVVEYTSCGWGMQDMRSMNIAKVLSEAIGCPVTSPATTVQENCASGGAAIHDIARRIRCGEIELGLAAGVESMSNIPRLLFAGRTEGQLYGDMTISDGLQGALIDPSIGKNGASMGLLTEDLVQKYKVTREQQDDAAYNSHKNAWEAWEKNFFDYVTPVTVESRKKRTVVTRDEGPKQRDRDYFTKQQPHFKRDGTGTITVANASSVNDGAAAIILASEKRAKELGLPILAELKAWGNIGVPRTMMGEGAFKVLPKILATANVDISDVSFFEINEAFAALIPAARNEIPALDLSKVNQWGSGVSIGHPVGCTGVRQVVDMCHQLPKRNGRIGVTSRCVGGGMGSGEVLCRFE